MEQGITFTSNAKPVCNSSKRNFPLIVFHQRDKEKSEQRNKGSAFQCDMSSVMNGKTILSVDYKYISKVHSLPQCGHFSTWHGVFIQQEKTCNTPKTLGTCRSVKQDNIYNLLHITTGH